MGVRELRKSGGFFPFLEKSLPFVSAKNKAAAQGSSLFQFP